MTRLRSAACAVWCTIISISAVGCATDVVDSAASKPYLVVNAARSDSGVYLTWNAVPGAEEYSIRSRVTGQTPWVAEGTTSDQWHFVSGVTPNTIYEFEVSTGSKSAFVSDTATIAVQSANTCSFPSYVWWIPEVNLFCTQREASAWMSTQGIRPEDLRCRLRQVDWSRVAPNCTYTIANSRTRILLQRAAGSVFTPFQPAPEPAAVRAIVRNAIWGAKNPFKSDFAPLLASQEAGNAGDVKQYSQLNGIKVVYDQMTASRISWFVPKGGPSQKVAIYHEGHGGAGVIIGAATIDSLLVRGWEVIAIDMPITGVNAEDITPTLKLHDDFAFLDGGDVSPIARYLMPVKVVVDSIVARKNPNGRTIMMVGRSGGGWTTYVYASVDDRIDIAVPIAGGRPMSERLAYGAPEVGDYEQSTPHLYDFAKHEDMMIAAGRLGTFLVFNQFDSCCYRTEPNSTFVGYLRAGGIRWSKPVEPFVDIGSDVHDISPRALLALDAFLRKLGK